MVPLETACVAVLVIVLQICSCYSNSNCFGMSLENICTLLACEPQTFPVVASQDSSSLLWVYFFLNLVRLGVGPYSFLDFVI